MLSPVVSWAAISRQRESSTRKVPAEKTSQSSIPDRLLSFHERMESLWPKIEASPTIFNEEKIWNIIQMLVWSLKKILWEELIVVSNPYISQLEMTGDPGKDWLINLFQTTIHTIGDSRPSDPDAYAQMTMGILWRSKLVTLYYPKDEEINPILERFIENTVRSIISRFESIFLRSYAQIIRQENVDKINNLLYSDTSHSNSQSSCFRIYAR